MPSENILSVVTSGKARTRLQAKRLELIDYLDRRLPELRIFGRDTNLVADKGDVLERSRYHLALENSEHKNYWTEKLADPIIMQNVTFYSGRNNWEHVFVGGNAIMEINVHDPSSTYETIRRVLDADTYSDARPELAQNKARLFGRYNLHCSIQSNLNAGLAVSEDSRAAIWIPEHQSRRQRLYLAATARRRWPQTTT